MFFYYKKLLLRFLNEELFVQNSNLILKVERGGGGIKRVKASILNLFS